VELETEPLPRSAVLAATPNDGVQVAKPDGGRALCSASAECGIGGMDRGAQERAEYLPRVVESTRLREVFTKAVCRAVSRGARLVCAWAHGEGHAPQ